MFIIIFAVFSARVIFTCSITVWSLLCIRGADHILAQPFKQCSASRIKPNETFEVPKKRQKILCFRGGGEKEFLYVVAKLRTKSQKPRKISWSYSFAVEMGHFDMVRWKIWLCLYFQHVTRYIGTDFVEESRQKMQRSEEEHFFRKGCFDRKECISNTANKRWSRQVLQLRYSSSYSIKFYT